MSVEQSTVEYREILGFPGYRIGDDGSVWSCHRRVGRGKGNGSYTALDGAWKPLKDHATDRGYQCVVLYPDHGRKRTKRIHQLVARAFIGPCPEGQEVCHFDGNRANNNVSNLRYATRKENHADRERHGNTPRGERNGMTVLSEVAVVALRADHAAGITSFIELGERHGVSRATARDIVNRRTWKHIA
jgi:hypothetical protein